MNKYELDAVTFESISEDIKDLDRLLTERIAELHNVDGAQQARHAYIYYRTFVWSIRDKLKSATFKNENDVIPIDRINNYGEIQHQLGKEGKELISFEDWRVG